MSNLNRDYLECSNCGLVEDGDFAGNVFTRKMKNGTLGPKTTMEFKALNTEGTLYSCPNCQNKLPAVLWDDGDE